MRSFLSRITGGDGSAYLKIRLKKDFVFLRGPVDEASEQTISGVLSLRLPCGQHATGVRLRMVGFLRCREHDVSTKRPDFRTIPIYEDELPPFVIDHGQKVSSTASGDIETHEWPFKLIIPGNTPETFRGCSCCSISYQLSASTIRGKTSTSMPTAYQPIRINRTVQNSAFELMDPMYMEGIWAENIRYCISIAHKAVALGTTVPLEIQLTPLNKKLQIKQIKCELLESHKFAINTARPLQQFDGDRQVAEWFAPVENPEDCAQPVYRVIQNLPLPTDPKKCSPDMDTEGLGTTHTLHIAVDVAQSDDNLLKFRYHATLPIVLFVSPKIPIDAFDNFVWPKSPEAVDWVEPDGGLDVPPEYGNHFDDEMLERSDSSNPQVSRRLHVARICSQSG